MELNPPENLHYLVVGPGSLGCLLSTSLSLQGFEVCLFDYDCSRAARLGEKGLTMIRGAEQYQSIIPVFCRAEDIPHPDIIFLCVKSGAVGSALQNVHSLLHEANLLIALQNGIGHLEIIDRDFPTLVWAAGVTALGANLRKSGEVVFAGSGKSRFGFLKDSTEKQRRLLRKAVLALNECGFEAEVAENIEAYIWEKLLINVGINALTAIHDCRNGELLTNKNWRNTLQAAVLEAAAVAKAKGILLPADPVDKTLAVCNATAANFSSMLQDVRRHRPTEIDAINGAIVRVAEKLSLKVPVNIALTEQVKEIERSFHASRGK